MSALHPINLKYSTAFYFYTSKSINQLIYCIGNVNSLQFQDLKYLYDDLEYLRRIYKVKTNDGRKQIQERIQTVANYYHQNYMLTSQIPLMFNTNHKDLFLKRQKKLRQLKQYSLYQKNPQNYKKIEQQQLNKQQEIPLIKPITLNNNHTPKVSFSLNLNQSSQPVSSHSTFLNDLSLSFDVLMNEETQEYLDINDQLDSSLHDVFDSSQTQFKSKNYLKEINFNQRQENEQDQKFTLKNIFKLDQQKLTHLVCDFQDFDLEQAIKFYREIVKTKNGSAIMSEILEQEHIKISRKSSENSKKSQNSKFSKSKENIIQSKLYLPISSKPPLPKPSKERLVQSYVSLFGPKIPKNSKQRPKLNININPHKQPQRTQEISTKSKLFISKYLDQVRKNIRSKSIQNQEQQLPNKQQADALQKRQNNKTRIRQKAQQLLDKIRRQSFSVDLR